MAEKRLARSSYDDYISTINKLTPHLQTLLAHISEQQSHACVSAAATGVSVADAAPAPDADVTAGACDPVPRTRRTTKPRTTRGTASKTGTRGSGAPRRRTAFGAEPGQTVQAVTNCGKIVYGTVRDGKIEVQGTVGEIAHDLLGVEAVNAGQRTRRTRAASPRRRSASPRRRASSPRRRTASPRRRASPTRRRMTGMRVHEAAADLPEADLGMK
ncbi:core protein [Squirrelpox virus]|uniref:25 kDa core protein OPG138 n=1 Tax=Squirrelpox virus TaxID=240426 RepID=U3UBD7_9POXV|nr:core protein [Squirrelpox virus]CCD83283.1 core protein [Squirrelpox virus]